MQKLTILDYAYMAALLLITICVCGSNVLRFQVIIACGTMAWSLAHIIHLRRLMKTSVPTDAVVVNYSVKTVKTHHKSGYTEEYQIYAPVLRYETDTQIIESPYSVYKRKRWFQDGEQYIIHYIPSKPEMFYFPERENELISDYQIIIILTVILLIISFGLGLPILVG